MTAALLDDDGKGWVLPATTIALPDGARETGVP